MVVLDLDGAGSWDDAAAAYVVWEDEALDDGYSAAKDDGLPTDVGNFGDFDSDLGERDCDCPGELEIEMGFETCFVLVV